MKKPKVLIYGAGSIGCYVGGVLLANQIDCTLVGRDSIKNEIEQHGGLTLTNHKGGKVHVPCPFRILTDSDHLPDADIVLLTVKNKDVPESAKVLAEQMNSKAFFVCLQNGVGAKETAARFIKSDRLLSGVVTFNVLKMGKGHFHCGNRGELIIESHKDFLLEIQDQRLMPFRSAPDIEPVLWGKLILNLNNCINALSGLTLLEQLSRRGYRLVLAASILELVRLLKKKGIKPVALNGLPPSVSSYMLKLPDFLFKIIAKKQLQIDPLARSSMWEDLESGKTTEIDFLNGAVVRLAKELGESAPVSSRLIELIRDAERSGKKSPGLSADQLLQKMGNTL